MELSVRVILHRSNPSVKISLKRHFWQGNPPVVDWLGQMVVIFIIYNSFEGSVSGKSKVGSNGVQQDQTKSDVFKSIFSSHSSAQNKPKGHWVTFDPRYNWKQHLSHFNKLSVPFLSLTELLWLYIMYCVQRIPYNYSIIYLSFDTLLAWACIRLLFREYQWVLLHGSR